VVIGSAYKNYNLKKYVIPLVHLGGYFATDYADCRNMKAKSNNSLITIFYQYIYFLSVKPVLSGHRPITGACNRSPGSKLLSITTQLHCGGHLGGRA
jgi:hypothetical protein